MTQPVWPTAGIDHLDRIDGTPARYQHPKDHDDLERAVNAILYVLGDDPQGAEVSVTARLLVLQNVLTQVRTELSVVETSVNQQILTAVASLNLANLALHHYVHYQRSGADVWVVNHGLGYDPVVAVVRDSPDQVILGFELAYASDHMSLTLGFSQVITGRAILSN